MVTYPELAKKVRFIGLADNDEHDRCYLGSIHRRRYDVRGLSKADIGQCMRALQAVSAEHLLDWEYELERKSMDAAVALILCLCVKLTGLSLGTYYLTRDVKYLPLAINPLLKVVRSNSDASSEYSGGLRHVRLGTVGEFSTHYRWCDKVTCKLVAEVFPIECLSQEAVLPFLCFPNLKTAQLRIDVWDPAATWPPPGSTISTSLARLSLQQGSCFAVRKLILACPQITSLEYESLTCQWDIREHYSDIALALAPIRETLKHLKISTRVEEFDRSAWLTWYIHPTPYMAPWLQDFTSLESLEIPYFLLFYGPGNKQLSTLLPRTLKILNIRYDPSTVAAPRRLFRRLSEFLRLGTWKSHCPRLQHIKVEYERSWH
jgi:hypothetical protein